MNLRNDIIDVIKSCNLIDIAYRTKKAFTGKVISDEIAKALDNFLILPCPETALSLLQQMPELLEVFRVSVDTPSVGEIYPKEIRGSSLEDYDEWVFLSQTNLEMIAFTHAWLKSEAINGKLRIGFHSLRDQAELISRLRLIGKRKIVFQNRRAFLRRIITSDLSAYRSVFDLTCIHGINDGHEIFWDGLGSEVTAAHYLISEIFYDITPITEHFIQNVINATMD